MTGLSATITRKDGHHPIIFMQCGPARYRVDERKEHLTHLAERLSSLVPNVIVLKGGMGQKQRHLLAEKITAIPDEEQRIVVATGRYLGEGFDDARLDTLFLVLPVSWRGTLAQYAGRLHRLHAMKKMVQFGIHKFREVSYGEA